ncbi:MAG: HNH endonuclease [Parcubacteria group bacterium]
MAERERVLHRIMGGVEMKRCSRCKRWLPLADFRKNTRAWDRLLSMCRTCSRAVDAKWRAGHREKRAADNAKYYAENSEKVRASAAKWRAENPERVRASQVAWQAENPEKARASATKWREENREKSRASAAKWRAKNREKMRAWREENPERVRAYCAKWRAENPERVRASTAKRRRKNPDMHRAAQARRRAKQKAATVDPVTAQELGAIRAEYGGICPYCGKRIDEGHFDHVMPLSKGGTHTVDNLAWVCATCNLRKQDKSLLAFMQKGAT